MEMADVTMPMNGKVIAVKVQVGQAIEEDKDGKRFEGTYVNDVRDGKFVEKDHNGQILARGYYESGRRFND